MDLELQPDTWFQDLFCADLGLCNRCEQDWGCINFDTAQIVRIAQYYLAHPEYPRWAREMLIESVLHSADHKLSAAPLKPDEDSILKQAVERAMGDLFDRDQVSIYWDLPNEPADPYPLTDWLHEHFPSWTPPESVWADPARYGLDGSPPSSRDGA